MADDKRDGVKAVDHEKIELSEKINVHYNHIVIVKFFIKIIVFLLIAQVLVLFLKFYLGRPNPMGLFRAFNFDTEGNIPTTFSALTLFFCSQLLFIISSISKIKHNNESIYWRTISVVFLFMGFDEIAQIHERFQRPIRNLIGNSAFFNFEWVILYSIIIVLASIFFIKFFLKQRRKIRVLFVISFAVYISGAIGFESLGTKMFFGKNDLYYAISYTIEELLEMSGVLIFAYSLLQYMRDAQLCLHIE